MNSEAFLKPRLVGGRFEGHAIPLEFLRDLAVLNDMIQEGARAEFLKANPDRKRSPRGFADDFRLVLSDIESGSVVPVITLLFRMTGFLPNPNLTYYEKARDSIVAAIKAVAEDKSPIDFLTHKGIAFFKNFGDRLRDGEAIELPSIDSEVPARLTKETRRKLLLALPEVQEVSEEVEVRGIVVLTNQGEKNFTLRLADGSEVPAPIVGDHYDNILEATMNFRHGSKLLIQGMGTRDRQGKLLRIDLVEQSAVLDALDVSARFEEIKCLKDGWFDGVGSAPASDGIKWLESAIQKNYIAAVPLPLPRIYASPEGTVLLEWSIASKSASLEVDLGERSGYWHIFDTVSRESEDDTMDLSDSAVWARLVERLVEVPKEQAK